jgi:hypothetical protein
MGLDTATGRHLFAQLKVLSLKLRRAVDELSLLVDADQRRLALASATVDNGEIIDVSEGFHREITCGRASDARGSWGVRSSCPSPAAVTWPWSTGPRGASWCARTSWWLRELDVSWSCEGPRSKLRFEAVLGVRLGVRESTQ